MQLSEFVFQGPYGCRTPVRITAKSEVEDVALPPGMKADDFHDLLTTVLYPTHTSNKLRMELAQNDHAKIVALFETASRNYRILRRGAIDTIRLQAEDKEGAFRDVAAGRRDVEVYLETKLKLPDFEQFWTLNFWRFDASPKGMTGLDADMLDPRVRDVVMNYRLALKAESVEDRTKQLESQISETQKRLGKGAQLEQKLRKAREKLTEVEVGDFSDQDLDLLKNRDEMLAKLEDQVLRLESELDGTRQQVDNTLPSSPFKNPLLLSGVALGLGTLILGVIVPQMRLVSLLGILGFGLATYVVLLYFAGMERASVHFVRLDSIKRRLGQVREEQTQLSERLNHLLIHAGVRDAKELGDRVGMTGRLNEMIAQLEQEVSGLRQDPEYVRATASLRKLELELVECQNIRDDLPIDVMSSYQLETDLQSMGIDPLTVREDQDAQKSEASEAEMEPLDRLLEAAHRTSQYDGVQLAQKTLKMWAKICEYVLGERFKDIQIKNGGLRVSSLGADQLEMWKRTRASEFQVVLCALALSVQVNALSLSTRGSFASVFVRDLTKSLTGTQPKKVREVFQSAARKSNIYILKSGA